ncbi:MAG: hypothetical protein ACLP5E_08355 [Streptosporangiaceae bacterium]
MRISGPLDLEAATVRCPLRLENCYLDNPTPVILDYATVTLLAVTGCLLAGLTGDRLVVTRGIDLTGSTLTGPLLLRGADITGQLSCRGAELVSADGEGNALAPKGSRLAQCSLIRDSLRPARFGYGMRRSPGHWCAMART